MKNKINKKKVSAFLWSGIYLVLTLTFCCSACLIFHSTYYRSIFVSGSSMNPTLLGDPNKAYFGIIDTTDWAKNKLHRFDIVTTYFPWEVDSDTVNGDYSAESAANEDFKVADGRNPQYKIKRVIAMPGETVFYFNDDSFDVTYGSRTYPSNMAGDIFILQSKDTDNDGSDDGDGEIIAIYSEKKGDDKNVTIDGQTYTTYTIPYQRKKNSNGHYGRSSIHPIAVPEGRYFVMGDNWTTSGSTDCGTSKMPIYKDNIVGVLAAIEGTCKISGDGDNKKCINRHYFVPKVF